MNIITEDVTTIGHQDYPSTSYSSSNQEFVKVNGINILVEDSDFITHCNPDGECHDPITVKKTDVIVTINGKAIMNINDGLNCSDLFSESVNWIKEI